VGIVENIGVALGISRISIRSRDIVRNTLTAGLVAAIPISSTQNSLHKVDTPFIDFGIVENIGVALGISRISLFVLELYYSQYRPYLRLIHTRGRYCL